MLEQISDLTNKTFEDPDREVSVMYSYYIYKELVLRTQESVLFYCFGFDLVS
jgi:hypothetical protein